jgi:hypothetical protein
MISILSFESLVILPFDFGEVTTLLDGQSKIFGIGANDPYIFPT